MAALTMSAPPIRAKVRQGMPLSLGMPPPAAMTNVGGQPIAPTPMQSPQPIAGPAAPQPTPYGTFTAPEPGTLSSAGQFRIDQANKGAQRSAASHGTLLSGGFQAALAKLNQGLASQEYDNDYRRALGTYETNRGTNAQNFSQSLGSFGAQRDVTQDAREDARLGTGVINANAQAQDLFRQQMEDYRAAVEAARSADVMRQNIGPSLGFAPRAPLPGAPGRFGRSLQGGGG